MVRYPPFVLSFTQAHPCDTPLCNVSRDTCAIPPKKQAPTSFEILSLQASRDVKGIAAGPLSKLSPSIVDLSQFFPDKEAKSHNRSGTLLGFLSWFSDDL